MTVSNAQDGSIPAEWFHLPAGADTPSVADLLRDTSEEEEEVIIAWNFCLTSVYSSSLGGIPMLYPRSPSRGSEGDLSHFNTSFTLDHLLSLALVLGEDISSSLGILSLGGRRW